MCSYNAVNGMSACLSSAMNNDKMRGEWGFDGFIVSDCDAISDTATHEYIQKHFNGSMQVQVQLAIRGGTDLNCGALYGEQNAAAVRSGLLREAELDVSMIRIYTKAFQLGVIDQAISNGTVTADQAEKADNPNSWSKLGPENVDTPVHRQLSLEGALQVQVLLEPEGIKKLALIGHHANGSIIFLGGPNYHGDNLLLESGTPLLRAQAKLPHAHACHVHRGLQRVLPVAVRIRCVMFLGLDDTIENEGHDRSSLELPGKQVALALAVAHAAKAPSGRPRTANSNINANCFRNFLLKMQNFPGKNDDFLLKNGRSFCNSRSTADPS